MTELFFRIWTSIVLVGFAVLALFVVLATLQFQNLNAGLTRERLAVLADRTAEPFAAPAKIGLPLSTVRNASALLERARQTDQQIEAVHVFDADGRIVHSTAAPRPERIPPEAMAALSASETGRWRLPGNAHFVSGVTIFDSGGEVAGGVMIEYPVTGHRTQVRAMAAELGLTALAGLVIVAGVGAWLLRLTLRRLFRQFESVEADIVAFEREAWRIAAGAPEGGADESGEPDRLRRLLPGAEAAYRRLGRSLAEAGSAPASGEDP